jgi:hypothetical protein
MEIDSVPFLQFLWEVRQLDQVIDAVRHILGDMDMSMFLFLALHKLMVQYVRSFGIELKCIQIVSISLANSLFSFLPIHFCIAPA